MPQIIAHSLQSRTKDVAVDGNVNFEALMLQENILKGLRNCGFQKPSPIQFKAIPIGRCGFDIVVKSKSGTGKTLVYSVISLETIDIRNHHPQVLILAPTREIAVQIQEVLTSIGSHIEGFKAESFIGGLPLEDDKEKCKNCHIAIGSPGRVKHLIQGGSLKPNLVRLLVLDEVDKLVQPSFLSDINEIFNSLPDRKQVITTSATYPDELYKFLCKYLLSPTFIEAESDTPLLLGLKQFIKVIKPYSSVIQELKCKNEELLNLFSCISFTQCVIFTNYQTRAESISNFLNQKGWTSTHISAAQSQAERLKTVRDLKDFKCKVLLSTDVSARGIDAAKVDLVINYDIPVDAVTYLHRMGRAGRYGSSGVCIDFVSEGSALSNWQNIIGLIGGSSLGVPKLPNCNGNILDLLTVIIPSENYIYGTISSTYTPDVNLSIKKNILDLKKEKSTQIVSNQHSRIQNNIDEASPLMSVDDDDNTNGQRVKFNKVEVNSKCTEDTAKFADIEQTASDCLNDNFNKNIKMNANPNLYSLTKDSLIIPKSQSQQSPEEAQFYKNRALLNVTQILSNDKTDSVLDLQALEHFLRTLKEDESNELKKMMDITKSREVKEILENIDSFLHPTETENYIPGCKIENDVENVPIQNIFKAGYEYATKSNSRHWNSYIPSSELCRFKEAYLDENETKINLLEAVDDDVYEEEQSNSIAHEFSEELSAYKDSDEVSPDITPQYMKWIPVEKVENDVPALNANCDHLTSYFNHCSESLWHTGLSFQSVLDFDNWFYGHWQSQVFSLRDYVQQNIYIQEMSRYQESKYKQNK